MRKSCLPVFEYCRLLKPRRTHASKPVQVDPIAAVLLKNHRLCVYRFADHAPCTEGVHWIVLEQPIEMSSAQIEAFKTIFHDNHRPLQKTVGREVDRESD